MKTIENGRIAIGFDGGGNIVGFRFDRVEFVSAERKSDLFQFRLRDFCGNPEMVSASDFHEICMTDVEPGVLRLTFSGCSKFAGLTACAEVRLEEADSRWRIRLAGLPDGYETEYIAYPLLTLAAHFAGEGGDARFFWPGYEGCLIDNLAEREQHGFGCEAIEYPMTGVGGFYPGPCAMQFQAFYTPLAGLYFGCHDATHAPKGIYVRTVTEKAIEPSFQHFTGGAPEIAYDTVLAGFYGDWQDAALKYRDWMTRNDPTLPPPLAENRSNPAWLTDSPVVAIYPVKGEGIDNGSQEPNEYFPYPQALPFLDALRKTWDAPVMALLMHWEGTAPWAPPYIWPPFGGAGMLREFADALHERGCLLGVYASGIGWTQRSMIEIGYNCEAQFKEQHLEHEICVGPRNERYSLVCNGRRGYSQRIGYDLCPDREFTAETVCAELKQVISAGVDYLQYFDQNQGCAAPLCYSREHGHPYQPGAWHTDAMRTLLERSRDAVKHGERPVVLGCENAAAEPYINVLQLNDLRSHLAFFIGALPVPAYAMLFHEYVNNFIGNGVGLAGMTDEGKSPEYLAYITAAGVSAGNLISVVLKDQGKIHYSWCRLWNEPEPDQPSLHSLIANLNRRRRTDAKPFLVYGEMRKAPECESEPYTIHFRNGRSARRVPSVLVSRWRSGDREAVVLINYRKTPMRAVLHLTPEEGGRRELEVPALDMVLLNLP